MFNPIYPKYYKEVINIKNEWDTVLSFFYTKSSKSGIYFTLTTFQLRLATHQVLNTKVASGQHKVRLYEERNKKHGEQASLLSGW